MKNYKIIKINLNSNIKYLYKNRIVKNIYRLYQKLYVNQCLPTQIKELNF